VLTDPAFDQMIAVAGNYDADTCKTVLAAAADELLA
jgi:hypothetical protein